MYETAFDIVALAMRYWFVLIVAYILFRLVQNVLLEFSSERTAQKRAAGYALGLLEVVEPVNSSLCGHTFALKRENTIGSARKCDIRLKEKSIYPLHAAVYQKGNKVFLSDYGTKQGVLLNGRRIKKDVPLIGGDEIMLGSVVLLLHLSGIEEAKRNDSYYYDDEETKEYLDESDLAVYANDGTYDGENDGDSDDEYDDEYDEEENDDYGNEYSLDAYEESGVNKHRYDDDEEEYEEDGGQQDDDDEIVFRDEAVHKKEVSKYKWDSYGNRRGREDHW